MEALISKLQSTSEPCSVLHLPAQAHASQARQTDRLTILDLDILFRLWPAERVVQGRSVCKQLRQSLASAPKVLIRVKRKEQPPPSNTSLFVASSLDKYNSATAGVHILGPSGSYPVASEGDLVLVGLHRLISDGWVGLEHLSLRHFEVGKTGPCLLAACLPSCINLKFLDLSDNDLTARGLMIIAEVLRWCQSLEHLQISVKNFLYDSHVCEALAEAFPEIPNLTHLQLADLAVAPFQSQQLLASVSRCSKLESLDLTQDFLGPGLGQEFAALGMQCTNLKQLNLRANNMVDEGIRSLCLTIPTFWNLRVVNLSINYITDFGIEPLVDVLPCCSFLESLDLSVNLVGDRGLALLANCVCACSVLQNLELAENEISDAAVSWILQATTLSSKTKFALQRNHISGSAVQILRNSHVASFVTI